MPSCSRRRYSLTTTDASDYHENPAVSIKVTKTSNKPPQWTGETVFWASFTIIAACALMVQIFIPEAYERNPTPGSLADLLQRPVAAESLVKYREAGASAKEWVHEHVSAIPFSEYSARVSKASADYYESFDQMRAEYYDHFKSMRASAFGSDSLFNNHTETARRLPFAHRIERSDGAIREAQAAVAAARDFESKPSHALRDALQAYSERVPALVEECNGLVQDLTATAVDMQGVAKLFSGHPPEPPPPHNGWQKQPDGSWVYSAAYSAATRGSGGDVTFHRSSRRTVPDGSGREWIDAEQPWRGAARYAGATVAARTAALAARTQRLLGLLDALGAELDAAARHMPRRTAPVRTDRERRHEAALGPARRHVAVAHAYVVATAADVQVLVRDREVVQTALGRMEGWWRYTWTLARCADEGRWWENIANHFLDLAEGVRDGSGLGRTWLRCLLNMRIEGATWRACRTTEKE